MTGKPGVRLFAKCGRIEDGLVKWYDVTGVVKPEGKDR